ncbi:MAG: hypothetical protein KAS93_06635 [Gammaproteobacteria bacterium]|nr:hypothetical protein [Gammaproteobacteria bacterium]
MKFLLDSDVEFEAENMDQALIKLALHFMSMMQAGPVLIINDTPPLDMVKIIKDGVPPLSEDTADGYINVEIQPNHEPPVMLQ